MEAADTLYLSLTNVALGLACLAVLGVVAAGIVHEVVARRHLRASLPDRWPPDGEDGPAAPPPVRRGPGVAGGGAS